MPLAPEEAAWLVRLLAPHPNEGKPRPHGIGCYCCLTAKVCNDCGEATRPSTGMCTNGCCRACCPKVCQHRTTEGS